jgi:hypothetical protein
MAKNKTRLNRRVGIPLIALSLLLVLAQLQIWLTNGEWIWIRTGVLLDPVFSFTALDSLLERHAMRGFKAMATWFASTHLYLVCGVFGVVLTSLHWDQK